MNVDIFSIHNHVSQMKSIVNKLCWGPIEKLFLGRVGLPYYAHFSFHFHVKAITVLANLGAIENLIQHYNILYHDIALTRGQ